MRITQFMIYERISNAFQKNMADIASLQNRLATGKKVNKPSDDVIGAIRAIDYKLNISYNNQYKRNITEATSQLSFTETVINSVSDALIRLKELAIQGADSSMNLQNRAAIAKEVEELRDHLLNLANSKFKGRYIFSGFKTDTLSFDSNSFSYLGDSGVMNVLIDRDTFIPVNITGDEAFIFNGETFMKIVDDLKNALLSNDIGAIRDSLEKINGSSAVLEKVVADIGARMNRLEDQTNRLEDSLLSLKEALSVTEDADIAETVTEYSKVELALQALRQTAARGLYQSLFDFLR
jgi:flagellar hook-associated protein 3 FlgL